VVNNLFHLQGFFFYQRDKWLKPGNLAKNNDVLETGVRWLENIFTSGFKAVLWLRG
jgi:hypothetical protein